jgi:FMN reductase [NAD(P)H]
LSSVASVLRSRFGQDRSAHPVLDDPPLARMLARGTCRRYAERTVNQEMVDALLDVAFSASSKSDYQQSSVIVVQDPERRRHLADLVPGMPWIGTAPVFLVFCADASRLEKICSLRDRPAENRNLEAFFDASIDAALVMQTFLLAAEQAGLGCCPISAIRAHLPRVRGILSLPDRVVPMAGLCVGYPAEPGTVQMRLPAKLTRHLDQYDDADLASRIHEYDRARAEQAPTRQDKQRNPERFGYADFYGWSEDKARQMQAGEGREFGAMIRGCGFTLE